VAEVLSRPPSGCSVAESGREVVVRATLRSYTGFFASLFFALFWNGVVSMFVLLAVAGLYTNLIGPLPPWFPAPEQQNLKGLGETLFLCIFLIPFVTIGAVMAGVVVLCAVGRIEVRLGPETATVRTGVGFLSWRRRFDPTQVRRVTVGQTPWETNGCPNEVVAIEADRTIKFGSLLAAERRDWLQTILHELLAGQDAGRFREILSKTSQESRLSR
jgi:hypothetical protein